MTADGVQGCFERTVLSSSQRSERDVSFGPVSVACDAMWEQADQMIAAGSELFWIHYPHCTAETCLVGINLDGWQVAPYDEAFFFQDTKGQCLENNRCFYVVKASAGTLGWLGPVNLHCLPGTRTTSVVYAAQCVREGVSAGPVGVDVLTRHPIDVPFGECRDEPVVQSARAEDPLTGFWVVNTRTITIKVCNFIKVD
ncbi:MAG TPA: hypothetical protein VM889_04920 [Candidatus Thermoplasmatota archaeon]|nr:hypothetical protein [Candidatus Thermoplasmatota archaeon]